MLIVLLINVCLAEDIKESFIAIGDKVFMGPDPKLEALLAQRGELTGEALASMTELDNWMNSVVRKEQRAFSPHDTRRTQTYFNVLGMPIANKSESTVPLEKVTNLIKDLVRSLQNRVNKLRPLITKYSEDERMRYGNAMCGLELWKKDMMSKFARVAIQGKELPVPYHVSTYKHMHTLNRDIHNVIDYLYYSRPADPDGTVLVPV